MSFRIRSQNLGQRRLINSAENQTLHHTMAESNSCMGTSSTAPNNEQHVNELEEGNVSRVGTQEASSFRVSRKRNGGPIDADQQETESDTASQNDAEREPLVAQDSSLQSQENYSERRINLRSSYNQFSSPVHRLGNNSHAVEELSLASGAEVPQMPLVRARPLSGEQSLGLDVECIGPSTSQISMSIFDDPLSSPPPGIFLEPPTIEAIQLAKSLVKLSRNLRTPDLSILECMDCNKIPVLPVTGPCGHTRCKMCIINNGDCPCTGTAPKALFVNTIVQEIIEKMKSFKKKPSTGPSLPARASDLGANSLTGVGRPQSAMQQKNRETRLNRLTNSNAECFIRPRMPMTVQNRYRKAVFFVDNGKLLEAAAHFARVAASAEPYAPFARNLLVQIITKLSMHTAMCGLSRHLRQAVREQATSSWLQPKDLECVLCTDPYKNPVTMHCGHTYCRECVEVSLAYSKKCALCKASLDNFCLVETRDTVFINSILESLETLSDKNDTFEMPIITCQVAFPGIACPLLILNPRYCLMVRQVLKSGTRRFGMVAHAFANYGTVLEIRDCLEFEDSRCILSTIGIGRFRVVEQYDKNGCDVARIQMWADMKLADDIDLDVPLLTIKLYSRGAQWLKNMEKYLKNIHEEIVTAFGKLPTELETQDLGKTSDGPKWMWWLVATLPLSEDIKFMILYTRSLLKRVLVLSHTLAIMEHQPASLWFVGEGAREPTVAEA